MTAPLILVEPASGPTWQPFVGTRPIALMRAGAWTVQERWEAAVNTDATEILGQHIAHFHEGSDPRRRGFRPVFSPATIAAQHDARLLELNNRYYPAAPAAKAGIGSSANLH